MNRREFITLVGGASAWPVVARAQQTGKVFRVGVIGAPPEIAGIGAGYPAMIDEFRKLGFSEGRNLLVEYRSSQQQGPAVLAGAADLVRSNVDVLIAIGTEDVLRAAVSATSTTPIVISAINYDPIARGYVKSLSEPGGNVTGVVMRQTELAEKQVELLTQTFPDKTRVAMLWDSISADQFSAAERLARSLGLQVQSLKLQTPPYDFDAAFRSMAENSAQMVLVLSSTFFVRARQRIVDLAIQHRLPTMFIFKLYVEAGGLMSYGVDQIDAYRRIASYSAKILRGAKPAELPIEQPNKFELVINLKTAKAIGIELSTSTLLRADEVIE